MSQFLKVSHKSYFVWQIFVLYKEIIESSFTILFLISCPNNIIQVTAEESSCIWEFNIIKYIC